tara:strand:+ start:145 stop:612 length:468 start_codon:yes stop_codon:yes gene_type:complete
MIKKIVQLGFLLIFLNNCGYTPIYSQKGQGFQINNIETFGELKVNRFLYNKFKVYRNNPNAAGSLNLKIDSKLNKAVIAKDKKGNPTQFSIRLFVSIETTDSLNNKSESNFSENITYDNSDNKFDLRKYEDNLIKNMTEKIFSEMILFIQSKNLT